MQQLYISISLNTYLTKKPAIDYHKRFTNPTDGVHMITNVGTIDRALRILAGIILITLAATQTIGVWGYIGIIPLLTGIFKFCPAYSLLGMSTCAADKK